MNIVFLDKDGTLGSFERDTKGLFPKTAEFLSRQKRKGRKLFVVTSTGAAGAAHLADLPLDGYFGREKADSFKNDASGKTQGEKIFGNPPGIPPLGLEEGFRRGSPLLSAVNCKKEKKRRISIRRPILSPISSFHCML